VREHGFVGTSQQQETTYRAGGGTVCTTSTRGLAICSIADFQSAKSPAIPQLFSHLFSGRYKSLVLDGSGNGYLRAVCDYVHPNVA
jgi:hypothetical protein